MSNNVVKTFDELADRYDSWFDRHSAAFESELMALKKVLPSTGEGLEIGVGSGRFAAALAIKTGVEPSEKLRSLALSRGVNVVEGTAESLPFPDQYFDFALLTTVLCFVESPSIVLQEAKRILKPNGVLIVGMIDRNSLLGQHYSSIKRENLFYKSAHFYSVDEVIKFLNENGFQKKEIYQTIFSELKDIKTPDQIKSGYGEGGFVAISASKK